MFYMRGILINRAIEEGLGVVNSNGDKILRR